MEPYTPITENDVPDILNQQLDKFSFASIHAEEIAKFDSKSALEAIRRSEGRKVIGADYGGDKGVAQLFTVQDGKLVVDEGFSDYVQGTHGVGYLNSMEKVAAFAADENIPVGLSWGAPLDGTVPLFHPKASTLLDELHTKYAGDFENVLPTLRACINDGPAGLISGVLEAQRGGDVDAVLLPINGGGLGMAVLANGLLYSTEAGHVEAVSELNTYGQTKPCGVFGASYVCIETLGANKAGIEAQWEARNGYLRAIEIEQKFKAGDTFAGELYDHSALVVAHMIIGTARALQIDLASTTTVVVGHGGGFKFPDYDKRVQQIMAQYIGAEPKLITSHSYSDPRTNACIEGAALAALLDI